MKKAFMVLVLIILSNNLYSQDYYFKQKDEFIQYTNSVGDFKTKLENTTYGNYRVKFEIGSSNKLLFTEYDNNVDMGWYGFLSKDTSQELKGKVYEISSYYSTALDEKVTVLFSKDKQSLVIIKNGKITEYKK